MKSFALASGSKGNCFYIESKNGFKILVDLGLSYKKINEILSSKNININKIDSVLITHEHSDHSCGLQTFMKNINCPIYLTKGTQKGLNIKDNNKFKYIKNYDMLNLDTIKTFIVGKSHDSLEAVSFVFEENGKKIGIFTDLGFVSDEIKHILKDLDIIYFEASYCENIIIKKDLNFNYVNRLVSNKGHLGIDESIQVLTDICSNKSNKKKIILSHISTNANTYENTYTKVKKAINDLNLFADITISFQCEPTDWVE